MSKIGRKPININGIQVEIKGQEIHYKGNKDVGIYKIPEELQISVDENKLTLIPIAEYKDMSRKMKRDIHRVWGLHRALLANELGGAAQEFSQLIEINGLGYKAVVDGKKITFLLGYSHKMNYELPKEVFMAIDKSGQKLTVKSSNKFLMGQVCGEIKSLRPPEPYKGTGIKLEQDVIIRKAGKTKAA